MINTSEIADKTGLGWLFEELKEVGVTEKDVLPPLARLINGKREKRDKRGRE